MYNIKSINKQIYFNEELKDYSKLFRKSYKFKNKKLTIVYN